MKTLILLIFCSMAFACHPIKATRNSFSHTKFCYSGIVQLEENIQFKIQGYYHIVQSETISVNYPPQKKVVDIFSDIVFFKDGSCVHTYNHEWLDGLLWGSYNVVEDTIKVHFIEPPRGMSWEMGYVWFKIIDTVTIKELHFKYRSPITIDEIVKRKEEDMPLGRFISMDSVAYNNVYKKNWLKHRKWYWCNEKDFTNWKIASSKK